MWLGVSSCPLKLPSPLLLSFWDLTSLMIETFLFAGSDGSRVRSFWP